MGIIALNHILGMNLEFRDIHHLYNIVYTREEGLTTSKPERKIGSWSCTHRILLGGTMMTSSLSPKIGRKGMRKAGFLVYTSLMPTAAPVNPFPSPDQILFLFYYNVLLMLYGFCCAAPNINDGHRIISPLVHRLDIRRALDYDGIPGVVGAGLGRATHILLGYTPSYTCGITLRPEPRTKHPFPAPELYTQEQADPSHPNSRRRNRQDRTVIFAAQHGEVVLPKGIPQVRLSDSGASSSGRVTHISPSNYFADPDMSRRLNLAAMVGRSGFHTPTASPSSTLPLVL